MHIYLAAWVQCSGQQSEVGGGTALTACKLGQDALKDETGARLRDLWVVLIDCRW